MTRLPTNRCVRTHLSLALAAAALLCAGSACAQQPQGEIDSVKLLELLVAKGVVSRGEADALLQQATVRPQAVVAPSTEPGIQTVPYIPETVRRQIKKELRAEVTEQAKAEGWAAPNQVAEWTRRVRLSGDVRVRGEAINFDEGNFPNFPDFALINAGEGYDISPSNPVSAPFINTSEDRWRTRVRARLGLNAQIDDAIAVELRVATGNDNSPVSTNQTLGEGTNLGKYELWLDRASVQLTPLDGLRIDIGRAENPFWSSELMFDVDLNFDGASARYRRELGDDAALFSTLGWFPVFNTSLSFGGSDSAGPFKSRNKHLLAAQIGGDFEFGEDARFMIAAGYFDFRRIQGRLSSPCDFFASACDTDVTRPQFQQFGNTLFPIRNVVPDPLDPAGSPEVQYFGLASEFRIANLHAEVAFPLTETIRATIEADYLQNVAFDAEEAGAIAVNNFGPTLDGDDVAEYEGGDQGWMANVTIGNPVLEDFGDWRLSLGYRYLESDAMVDAFADSNFHLGGTNARGYVIRGSYAIGKRTWLGMRWLSANEASGPPYSVDVLQLDLNAAF